jgi:hypothetical protein
MYNMSPEEVSSAFRFCTSFFEKTQKTFALHFIEKIELDSHLNFVIQFRSWCMS